MRQNYKRQRKQYLKRWRGGSRRGLGTLEGGFMAVVQPTKNKIKPVFDFRLLNKHVSCHTGREFIDVFGETLRRWRQNNAVSIIGDLKSAYQHIASHLRNYELVRCKERTYCPTQLGFGLNVTPKIMAAILKIVLKREKDVRDAADSFIDDILVDQTEVPVQRVLEQLERLSLTAKCTEMLDGGEALGLRLNEAVSGELKFRRGNTLPEVVEEEINSGKLIGYYPVTGWLWTTCSYMKRKAEGTHWKDKVCERTTAVVREIFEEVKKEDPMQER